MEKIFERKAKTQSERSDTHEVTPSVSVAIILTIGTSHSSGGSKGNLILKKKNYYVNM